MRINETEAMRVFVAVVELGSFSAAAQRLGMQQSAVSRQISALEDFLSAPLLVRTTRSLSLTESGRLYLQACRNILADISTLSEQVRASHQEAAGVLRLSVPNAFGRHYILPSLRAFLERYPKLAIEVELEDRRVDVVSSGFDVVIRVGESPDAAITSRKIAIVRRSLYGSTRLLQRVGPIESPEALAHVPVILFEERMPLHPRWTLANGRARRTVEVRPVACVNQLDVACSLALDGLGVAQLPDFVVERTPGPGAHLLKRVLPEWELTNQLEPTAAVYALFSGGPRLSAKVRAFVDHLVGYLSRI